MEEVGRGGAQAEGELELMLLRAERPLERHPVLLLGRAVLIQLLRQHVLCREHRESEELGGGGCGRGGEDP